MTIDKRSRVPLYVQLMNIIIYQINNNQLKEGDKLPFENEFCELYQISRTTVRQALSELEKDGYIRVVHGKGTFVTLNVLKQNLATIYSFNEEMKKMGKVPSTKVISFRTITPNDLISTNLNTTEMVYEIERLRYADQQPILYEYTYLPLQYCPDLSETDFAHKGLYALLKEKYGIKLDQSRDTFKAVKIDEKIAHFLDEVPEAPGLQIERIAYENEIPMEFTIEIARGSKFAYTIELKSAGNIKL